jgi:hypothetical protein
MQPLRCYECLSPAWPTNFGVADIAVKLRLEVCSLEASREAEVMPED